MTLTKSTRFAFQVIILLVLLAGPIDGIAQSDIDLAIQHIEAALSEDQRTYDVEVYLSVMDGLGFPIKDLKNEDFFVTEDLQKVDVQDVRTIGDEPINLVLVIDISEGMSGIGTNDTKAAVKKFISTLRPHDPVALITFDEKLRSQTNFTTDRTTISDHINLIPSFSTSGTCIYDATYSAIQMASRLTSGNRSVLLLTDGIDETEDGAICSVHTVDDVIDLASRGGTRTPIYTIEMGGPGDNNILRRIAEVTGGYYLHSGDGFVLPTMLQQVSDRLTSQYIITYHSFAGSGPHTLDININQFGVQATDTRNFVLPLLPTRIAFVKPQEGEIIRDTLSIEVALLSQDGTVERIAFQVNGVVVGTDDTKPYELSLDTKQLPEGIITVSAIAYGPNNNELSSSTVRLLHVIPAIAPTVVDPTAVEPGPPNASTVRPIMLLGVLLGGLGILTIILLISMLVRQQKDRSERAIIDEIDSGIFTPMPDTPSFNEETETENAGKWGTGTGTFGTLVVESSDDTSLVGHHFYLIYETTSLGRSADNEICFPKDNPVSRRHAELFVESGRMYLREVTSTDAAGVARAPKYGTFLNNMKLSTTPAPLKTGDKILLGRRLQLQFEAGPKLTTIEGGTFDEMTAFDDIDKTELQS
jgi:VWFA-related protein